MNEWPVAALAPATATAGVLGILDLNLRRSYVLLSLSRGVATRDLCSSAGCRHWGEHAWACWHVSDPILESTRQPGQSQLREAQVSGTIIRRLVEFRRGLLYPRRGTGRPKQYC